MRRGLTAWPRRPAGSRPPPRRRYGSCPRRRSPGAGLGGQGHPERGRQRLEGRRRTAVGHADAQLGDPARPVRLIHRLRHHHLRCAGRGGPRRGARAAVVHDRGHPAEQRVVVDPADDEAVVRLVDDGEVRPAAHDDRAAALRPHRLADHAGEIGRGVHGHAAEAHVHRRWASVEERHQVVRQRRRIGQHPGAGLDDVEVRHPLPRVEDGVGGDPRLTRRRRSRGRCAAAAGRSTPGSCSAPRRTAR